MSAPRYFVFKIAKSTLFKMGSVFTCLYSKPIRSLSVANVLRCGVWFFLYFAMFIFLSCRHTVEIVSDPPGATVIKQTSENSRGVTLGQTPLKYERKNNERGLVLDISAKGFVSKQVVTSHLNGIEKINVKLKKLDRDYLKQEFKTELQSEITSAVNRNVEIVVRLQKAVVERDNAEVTRIQNEFGEDLKDNEIYNSLMYNFHILRGSTAEAEKFNRKFSSEGKNNNTADDATGQVKNSNPRRVRANKRNPRESKNSRGAAPVPADDGAP